MTICNVRHALLPAFLGLGLWMVSTGDPLLGQQPQTTTPVTWLTNFQQLVTLKAEDANSNHYAARVTGVITYASVLTKRIFLQEGDLGIQVTMSGSNRGLQAGQRVEVTGPVEPGRPYPTVAHATAKILGTEPLPAATNASPHELATGAYPYRMVRTRGVVRDITLNEELLVLLLSYEGASFEVWVSPVAMQIPRQWIDAEIEVTGMAFQVFNARGKVTLFDVSASSLDQVKILKLGPGTLFGRPLQSISEAAKQVQDWGPRYRFSGVVTYFRPGLIYLQDGEGVMLSIPLQLLPMPTGIVGLDHEPQTTLEPGERIEVIGVRHNWYSMVPTTVYSEYRRLGRSPLPTAQPVSARDLQVGRFPGRIVSLEGQLLNQRGWGNAAGYHQLLTLRAGEEVVQATWTSETSATWKLKPDSYVRVTGVHESEGGVVKGRPTFQLLMRSPADVVAIATPPFWTRPQFWKPGLAGLGVAILALAWIGVQRRQMLRLRASEERLEERVAERTSELQVSEQRTRLIVDTALDAVVTMDAAGNISGWNAQAESIFGWTREEVLGKSLSKMIIPSQYREAHERGLRRFLETGQGPVLNRRIELSALRRSGREFPAELTVNALRSGDTHIFSAFIRDITDRKHAEDEMLKALEREKELNQLKSNFVALVSHEFRTPLEVILTSSDILDRYLDRLTPERRATCLSTIRGSVKRMSGMMEDVLLLGRVEAGKLEFKPEPLDLRVFCERIVEEIQAVTTNRCPIDVHCKGALDQARGDETLLRHMLTNLLSNGVKYSNAGSAVRLSLERLGDQLAIIVADQGRGIPQVDHARLFQSFQRGSNVSDTPGTGLGLLLVQKCVDVHGGKISFESEEGKGTTFRVMLPLFALTSVAPSARPV